MKRIVVESSVPVGISSNHIGIGLFFISNGLLSTGLRPVGMIQVFWGTRSMKEKTGESEGPDKVTMLVS